MRILILNWRDMRHPRAGGAEVRLHEVYGPMVTAGHEVILYSCAYPGGSVNEVVDGIQVNRIGNDATFAFLCLFNLRKWVRHHQPDLVVEDLNKLPFFSPLVYRGPLLIQMHHLWRKSIFREASFPVAMLVWHSEQLIRKLYRKCFFSVVSDSTCDELVEMGIPQPQIRVIHNGADLTRYVPGSQKREPLLLWIGRIQKYKGPLDACRVLQKLLPEFPELKLMIVGDGPFRGTLEKYVIANGLQEQVRLTGFISEEDKIDLLQRSAVHLQSSYKEGWGLSVIEANACGCPVVANDTTGLRDSCRDEETGLLYKHCDLEDAVSKVRRILSDDDLRTQLTQAGLHWAGSFSWERNTREILHYLEEILEKGTL
jgi:glycosyltransferase involved in cell wall biosynthesis